MVHVSPRTSRIPENLTVWWWVLFWNTNACSYLSTPMFLLHLSSKSWQRNKDMVILMVTQWEQQCIFNQANPGKSLWFRLHRSLLQLSTVSGMAHRLASPGPHYIGQDFPAANMLISSPNPSSKSSSPCRIETGRGCSRPRPCKHSNSSRKCQPFGIFPLCISLL